MLSSNVAFLVVAIFVAVLAYWFQPQTALSDTSTIRVDSATGIQFPVTQRFHFAPNSPMSLLGVGTRKLAVINLYSLGLYMGSNAAKALVKSSSSSSSSNKKDDRKRNNKNNKCEAILASTAHKAVTLTFQMSIGPERIAEALSAVQADEAIKSKFRAMIVSSMGGKMLKGESMTLEWKGSHGDILAVSIRNNYVGELKDKALAWGVMDLYVGPKSVSPSLRKDLGCA
jgi:hypothetical protein